MVCLGNICRSPIAEGVLEHMAAQNGLNWTVDSAGTSGWHNGEQPDRRAIATCKAKGIDITRQRSRKLTRSDFETFDLILTMDGSNLRDVLALAGTEQQRQKVSPILEYAGITRTEVPDPYYDGRFQEVYELLWESCQNIIAKHTD